MKRRLFKLVVFILLGAIVNVAVAWASSIFIGFADTSSDIRAIRGSPAGGWFVETYHRFSAFRVEWFRSRSLTVDQSEGPSPGDLVPTWIGLDPELNENRSMEFWDAEARGWPLLALWSKPISVYEELDGTRHHLPKVGTIELPLTPFRGGMEVIPKVLPLCPIWPGFAVNTIFYAVILWLLTLGAFTARRIIRRRRGLCIKCGYNLRGTSGGEVCPECGVETAAKVVE
ncbi:MAG: hypothetical protein V3T53_03765 [Phycisphaerales bacterium]